MRMLFLARCVALAVTLISPAYPQRENFSAQVLRVAGMAPGAGAATDPDDEIDAGELWTCDPAANTRTKLAGPDYRSPVFSPSSDAVLALRGETIVRIPVAGGDAEPVYELDSITKLVGFAPDGRLLLTADDGNMVGFYSLDDKRIRWITPDSSSAEDKAALDRIRGWERVYGSTRIDAERQTADNKRWTDVFLHDSGKDPLNVSRCEGVACGQAAFSPARHLVVFVKAQP